MTTSTHTTATFTPDQPYSFEYDVQIFDTDCYGVIWHGAYVKWLEMGRVDMLKHLGIDLKQMSDAHDIVFPVVEQNTRFRASGRFGDRVRLTTTFTLDGYKFFFTQQVVALPGRQRPAEQLLIEAQTTVVMVNLEGRLYRKLPDILYKLLLGDG
ncbi:MAG: acyl-CoA thioesterase [Cyanobacteria bacterium HKST-UBA06]|nr:acyl-CoA thioesterase [Cyanobacteria bacterium HKST-UBA06]